jgi:hypothetical protein
VRLTWPLSAIIVGVACGAAHALVLCTTPDGKTYAGDKPPADCKVKSEYVNPPSTEAEPQAATQGDDADRAARATAENAADAQAIKLRRQLEDGADAAAEELGNVRHRLTTLPVVNPANYRDTPSGWQAYEQDVHAREAQLWALHSRESELIVQIAGLRRDFTSLTGSLARAHGGAAPSWWGPMRCSRCP